MDAKDRLDEIARQLREGTEVPSITVREFLRWFDAQRRGSFLVWMLREILKEAGLQTEPDFQSAYLDSKIKFVLAKENNAEGMASVGMVELTDRVSITDDSPGSATLVAAASYADPTYRISKLGAANNTPISVAPDTTIEEAVTVMLVNDFSQLPAG